MREAQSMLWSTPDDSPGWPDAGLVPGFKVCPCPCNDPNLLPRGFDVYAIPLHACMLAGTQETKAEAFSAGNDEGVFGGLPASSGPHHVLLCPGPGLAGGLLQEGAACPVKLPPSCAARLDSCKSCLLVDCLKHCCVSCMQTMNVRDPDNQTVVQCNRYVSPAFPLVIPASALRRLHHHH